MKVRLIVWDDPDPTPPPLVPLLLAEGRDGLLVIISDSSASLISDDPIDMEEVTLEPVRRRLGFADNVPVYVSEARELPGGGTKHLTPQALKWSREWYTEFVTQIKQGTAKYLT